MGQKFCFVNISGVTFCINCRILRRYPYTKLAAIFDISNPHSYANATAGSDYQSAIFFDRNPVVFCSILDFYRTGQLHVPHSFCFSVIQEELEFWRIDASHLAECCAVVRESHKKNIQEIKEVQAVFGDQERLTTTAEKNLSITMMSPFRYRLHTLFNSSDRKSGPIDNLYFGIYLICAILHLTSYIVQADYRVEVASPDNNATCPGLVASLTRSRNMTNVTEISNTTRISNNATAISDFDKQLSDFMQLKYSKYFVTRPAMVLRAIDLVCMGLFIVDTVLRALSVQTPKQFVRKPGNCFDIICSSANVIAFAISLRSTDGTTFFNCSLELLTTYLMLEIFRVFRLARLLQFANKYNGIIVLLLTVRNSLYELGLLLAALGSGVVLFGFLAYIAELGNDSSMIKSFPMGFWWAVVTMTTLGYGDVYPATVFGYLIGACCAISGVIFMAVQVPVIGNKFNAFYTYACEQAASQQNDLNKK